ncbi:MAG: M14 family zinc carboxypeptidase, partial [Spirochaetaceae bacterium]
MEEGKTRVAVLTAALAVLFMTGVALEGADAEVIGESVEGRAISVERVGDGPLDVMVIGGIHGGYEHNSIVLARRLLEHYRRDPSRLPDRFTLHVIDNMNPDGVHRVTGGTPIEEFDFPSADTVPGRFNARWVDLNRNWAGDWQPTSYWGRREVDAGSE